jgi:hypothetical protein
VKPVAPEAGADDDLVSQRVVSSSAPPLSLLALPARRARRRARGPGSALTPGSRGAPPAQSEEDAKLKETLEMLVKTVLDTTIEEGLRKVPLSCRARARVAPRG